jgi:hypothetical protein
MKVSVEFICKDLTEGLKSGIYDVPETATVTDVIRGCEIACGVTLPEENKSILQFLLNGRGATWDTAVRDGSQLYVLRSVFGG